MDSFNKKVFDKRMEMVDKEIEQCAITRRKISYEDMLEKLGITAEAVKMVQPTVKPESKIDAEYSDFPLYQHGIENFDPKNRLLSLRTIGSLKSNLFLKSKEVLAIEDGS